MKALPTEENRVRTTDRATNKEGTLIMNGAQAWLKALTDAGLDPCFANPGTSEMELVYEMGRTEQLRISDETLVDAFRFRSVP